MFLLKTLYYKPAWIGRFADKFISKTILTDINYINYINWYKDKKAWLSILKVFFKRGIPKNPQ